MYLCCEWNFHKVSPPNRNCLMMANMHIVNIRQGLGLVELVIGRWKQHDLSFVENGIFISVSVTNKQELFGGGEHAHKNSRDRKTKSCCRSRHLLINISTVSPCWCVFNGVKYYCYAYGGYY